MTDTPCTRDRLEALVRNHSGLDDYPILFGTNLRTDLCLDSLDLIQLAMKVEDVFGIHIPDERVDSPALATFGGLLAYVEDQLLDPADRARRFADLIHGKAVDFMPLPNTSGLMALIEKAKAALNRVTGLPNGR